jgi:hypothetical protein
MQSETVDPWLALYLGDDGAFVQGDDSDDGTPNAEIVFTTPEDETFVFEATSAEPAQTGAYAITVDETEPPLERGGAAATCSTRTLKIAPGQKLANTLSSTDCAAPQRPSSYHTRYSLRALAGATFSITLTSEEVSSRLYLLTPTGTVIAEDDDGAGKLNARVALTAPFDGVYTIVAATTGVRQTGRYELAVAGRTDDTVGVYVPATGAWFLRNENAAGTADLAFGYGPGQSQLVALSGDWDGDGTETAGLYDPATGSFLLKNTNAGGPADRVFVYGPAGAVPLVGDWNGR